MQEKMFSWIKKIEKNKGLFIPMCAPISTVLKFSFSEKATKIWRYRPQDCDITM